HPTTTRALQPVEEPAIPPLERELLDGPTRILPLGTVAGARSGDKAGSANIGVWARDARTWRWLTHFLTVEQLRRLLPETALLDQLDQVNAEHAKAVAGGGPKYTERHHARGRLLPRERIELLVDPRSPFLELSPLAAWGSEFPVGGSVVTGIGVVSGIECM